LKKDEKANTKHFTDNGHRYLIIRIILQKKIKHLMSAITGTSAILPAR